MSKRIVFAGLALVAGSITAPSAQAEVAASSGSAANTMLDPVAGGCFCEAIPGDQPGSVEHMRVIQARPGATLVMCGSLRPLQGEALTGVLTVTLEPLGEGGTRLGWTYVVGGYARFALPDLAPAVDGVIGEQMARLAAHSADGG